MVAMLQKVLMFSRVASLNVLHDYFDGPTKLYLAKFLNTSSKPVFSCNSPEIFNLLKLNYGTNLLFLNKKCRVIFFMFITWNDNFIKCVIMIRVMNCAL